jgi:peptidoglycan/xylan/chitin deacetylase (PgdA/CDA1 family)
MWQLRNGIGVTDEVGVFLQRLVVIHRDFVTPAAHSRRRSRRLAVVTIHRPSQERQTHRFVRLACVVAFVASFWSALAVAPQSASAVSLSGVSAVISNPGGLNLRRSASWSGSVIKTLPTGTRLTVLGTNADWFKVTARGSTGYVNSWRTTLIGTPSTVIRRGNVNRKMVALTFDAGSDLGYTRTIIRTLEQYGVRASFGLTGDWVDAYPDYAAWIAGDGFQVINHTLNHPSYTGESAGEAISPARRLSQIVGNESKLRAAGASSKPYWRPPYGDIDDGVLRDVGAGGYGLTVMWTIDSMGWNGYSADQIVSRVLGNIGNGSIVLMHVGAASQDAAALPRIIKALQARGYRFGTVANVIAP